MKDSLRFLPILKNIPRSGWLQSGVCLGDVESVSEHSFDVASLAMIFCDVLRSKGRVLDYERTIRAAILHDWAESLTMDMPRSARIFLEDPDSAKHAEKKAFETLLKDLPSLKKDYLDLWKLAHSDSDEGNLVKLADLCSMHLQAERYELSGNKDRHLQEIKAFAKKGIEKRLKIFPELKTMINK